MLDVEMKRDNFQWFYYRYILIRTDLATTALVSAQTSALYDGNQSSVKVLVKTRTKKSSWPMGPSKGKAKSNS